MKKTYDIVIERDSEGYYVASVPALPGCHAQAKSLDLLMKRIHEAVLLCQEEYGTRDSAEFVGVQCLAIS